MHSYALIELWICVKAVTWYMHSRYTSRHAARLWGSQPPFMFEHMHLSCALLYIIICNWSEHASDKRREMFSQGRLTPFLEASTLHAHSLIQLTCRPFIICTPWMKWEAEPGYLSSACIIMQHSIFTEFMHSPRTPWLHSKIDTYVVSRAMQAFIPFSNHAPWYDSIAYVAPL